MEQHENTAPEWFEKLVACPSCGTALRRAGDAFVCGGSHQFPITGGVPRFVDDESYADTFGVEWNTFRKVQLDSANGTRISLERFGHLSTVRPDSLRGKLVLEVGCGSGRFMEVLADAGARVTGVDLSRAVEAAADNLRGRDVAIAQADVFALPFTPGSFDYVYSFGVIHHTPSPAGAVRAMAKLVKPGGKLTVWVYGRRGPMWIPRPHRVYTPFFRALPVEPRLKALRLYTQAAIPLGRLPIAGRVFRQLFPVQDLRLKKPTQDGYVSTGPQPSEELVQEWAWLNAFDMFTPQHATQHVWSEVETWFRDAGLVDLERAPARVAVTGTKPA